MGFRRSRGREDNERSREPRVNHRIRVPEVRLVGLEAEQLGIVPVEEAMRLAQEAGVDLVEVAPTARPPVCRIMDYGKFKYLQKKRAQEAKRSSTHIEVKEVKFRPKTERHDFETKMNRARRFLGDNNRVKVTIMFRGREMAYTDAQRKRLLEISQQLSDIAILDVHPKMEGRTMSMMLNPKKGGAAKEKNTDKSPEKARAAAPEQNKTQVTHKGRQS
ncbi:MAG: translation initiation factor IF-3 [Myxococcales bacterium]|nr:translation initiation factor IF-3 [Myxococcales bacterium]